MMSFYKIVKASQRKKYSLLTNGVRATRYSQAKKCIKPPLESHILEKNKLKVELSFFLCPPRVRNLPDTFLGRREEEGEEGEDKALAASG